MTNSLLVDNRADHITIITLNRPDHRNALDLATMHGLATAVADLEHDSQLRAVIITGAGSESFCSGLDLYEFSVRTSAEDARSMQSFMTNTLMRLERLPVPIIAAINGYALGGGSELAVACDLRIADEHTRLGFVHAKNALTTGWGASQRLLRLVGYARALDILLTSRILRAPELLAIGLANRVAEAGSSLEQAIHYAQYITQTAPRAVRGMKSLLRTGLNESFETVQDLESELFPPLWEAPEHVQSVEAYLKRDRKNS